MSYVLPELPYAYNALEPYIDAFIMQLHYERHHKAYVDNLNKAVEPYAHLHGLSIQSLLENLDDVPQEIRDVVRNNGGGHYNHSLFWRMMTPQGQQVPHGAIAEKILETFGSFSAFQDEFTAAAKTVFGSGWAWLVVDTSGHLSVMKTFNQDSPLMYDKIPLLGLDVWEHAYYLQYHNKRPDYISAWWHVVNWNTVEDLYQAEYV